MSKPKGSMLSDRDWFFYEWGSLNGRGTNAYLPEEKLESYCNYPETWEQYLLRLAPKGKKEKLK